MRTADRVLADGVHPHQFAGQPGTAPDPQIARIVAENQRDQVARLREDLRSCPILLADNVAAYVEQHVIARGGYSFSDFPSLAPPWPTFWIEYRSGGGGERRGVLVRDVTDEDRTVDGAFQNCIDDARQQGYDGEIRWILDLTLVVEDIRARVVMGPVGWLVLALDPNGHMVGNRWVINSDLGPQVVDKLKIAGTDASPGEWMLRATASALQSVAFLHCRNVLVDDVVPPPKVSRKHHRRHGRPLVRYKTIRLEVPRSRTAGPRSTGGGQSPALHIVPGHFCVDAATEVLTDRGWLSHVDLKVGDAVGGFDLLSGYARWVKCLDVHRFDVVDEPVLHTDSRDLSMRLTANHRCVVDDRHRPGLRVIPASELHRSHAIPRSALWDSAVEGGIGQDLAALCGWVAAEGHVHSGSVYLCQSGTANPGHVVAIDALLARLGAPAAVRDRKNIQRRVLSVGRTVEPDGMVRWRLPLGLSQAVRRLMPGKLLPWEFVSLPTEERRALLEAFIDGDGNRRGSRVHIGQRLRQNLDVLQAVAVTLGYRTRLSHEPRADGPFWRLAIIPGTRPLGLRKTSLAWRPYTGVVWCPTTETGTWFARRNGVVFITGNSHYGDCCPGQHEPNGLLFGKLAGVYWMPSHLRGNPRRGLNLNDYELVAEGEAP